MRSPTPPKSAKVKLSAYEVEDFARFKAYQLGCRSGGWHFFVFHVQLRVVSLLDEAPPASMLGDATDGTRPDRPLYGRADESIHPMLAEAPGMPARRMALRPHDARKRCGLAISVK
jgi:hypothetical protein